ncbi:MAG: peptidoglycan-binding protein, partial [Candidatus Saccharibacteria bacterium]|nr:peptidoglycan-binding protein [Candidatus Saccharibacteria bacterium]
TQSCAWKRAMDAGACSTSVRPEDYDNYNPDLNPAANPDSFALTGVLSIMSAAFKLPPAGEAVCKVLTSWFSWVIQGVEVALSIWVGGVTTVAAQAIKGALVGMLVQLVVPKLLDAATGLAITGSENAVGLINNSDAGLNLSAKNYGRFMGNRTGTNKENYKLIAAAKAEEIEYANDQGWTYRAFALSNNHSLVNRVISQTPSTGTGMLAAIQSSLKSLPTNFAAAFLKPRTALAEGDEMEDPYGFRPYVTTDDELSKYPDPVDDIEDYLYQEVTKDDGSKTTRLQMLGDPKDYTPADGEDTDTTNLRHCFVGKFRAPTKEAADPICLDLGVLTQRDGVTNKIITNPRNPGRHEIKQLIYCEVHQACGVSYNDDFEKYRLYLKYVFLTKAMDGMTTDKDPFAGTGNNPAISETYGICETPAKGSDPGAPVPPNNYSRTTIDGKTVNMRTKFMYDQALKYARQLGYNGPLYVVQGSYHPGVGASEGTHDGGGALDISVNGMTGGQRTIVVTALRMAGFAAWNRGQPYDSAFVPHIHAMAIGDRDITHAIAKDQISDYFLHRSGLSGDGPDQDAKSGYPFPDWAGQICMSMGLAG